LDIDLITYPVRRKPFKLVKKSCTVSCTETGTAARWFLRVSCVKPLAAVPVSVQDTQFSFSTTSSLYRKVVDVPGSNCTKKLILHSLPKITGPLKTAKQPTYFGFNQKSPFLTLKKFFYSFSFMNNLIDSLILKTLNSVLNIELTYPVTRKLSKLVKQFISSFQIH
jgi:hypothetical protein